MHNLVRPFWSGNLELDRSSITLAQVLRRRRQQPTASDSAAPPPDSATLTEPYIEHMGSPLVAAAASAMQRGDRNALIACFEQSTNWGERQAIIREALSDAERRRLAMEWGTASPDDPRLSLAHGVAMILDAWEIRGSGVASTVGSDAATQFIELLRRADAHLEHTLRLDPSSPLPWNALLMSGRGLSISHHELTFRFEQLCARCPDLLDGHRQYLQGICAKWCGTTELMQAFVQSVVATAPMGSPLHVLRVDEVWELSFVNETNIEASLAASIEAIHDAARRSVLVAEMPNGVHDVDALWARNMFAVAFAILGDRDVTDYLFTMIAGRYTDEPWTWWNRSAFDEVVSHRWALIAPPASSPGGE